MPLAASLGFGVFSLGLELFSSSFKGFGSYRVYLVFIGFGVCFHSVFQIQFFEFVFIGCCFHLTIQRCRRKVIIKKVLQSDGKNGESKG